MYNKRVAGIHSQLTLPPTHEESLLILTVDIALKDNLLALKADQTSYCCFADEIHRWMMADLLKSLNSGRLVVV
jgi:hypothetical protein